MHVTTIDQARAIVRDLIASSWERGTLAFSGRWHEDADAVLLRPEALEWLRDGDERYMVLPGATPVVDKHTGEVTWEVYFPGSSFRAASRSRDATP